MDADAATDALVHIDDGTSAVQAASGLGGDLLLGQAFTQVVPGLDGLGVVDFRSILTRSQIDAVDVDVDAVEFDGLVLVVPAVGQMTSGEITEDGMSAFLTGSDRIDGKARPCDNVAAGEDVFFRGLEGQFLDDRCVTATGLDFGAFQQVAPVDAKTG